jgi:hypothetical protein
MTMSEKHDVTQSSNPDVQALLIVSSGLAARVERAEAKADAAQAAFDSLPSQFVVPGPGGGIPNGTVLAGGGEMNVAGSDGAGGGGGGEAQSASVTPIKQPKVKTGKAVG